MTAPEIQGPLAGTDAVFDWCLRGALRAERLGEAESAARWAYVGAGTAAAHGHSSLCSPPLEALLGRLGERLPAMPPAAAPGPAGEPPRHGRWLHVFTMSHAIGGHTALARRWIEHDAFGDRHDLALTMQGAAEAECGLASAVERSGGRVASVATESTLLGRARRLRELAAARADVVVLHAHPWDVVPALAFANPGGPPVLLMNHADHAFWVGSAVADAVVDIRDSGRRLSAAYRGARGSLLLPVALPDHGPAPRDRREAAARLGDPTLLDAGLVLLTIGSAHKYWAIAGLDFPAAVEQIVEAVPECRLIAVGPHPDDSAWPRLRQRFGGRVRAVGPDRDLAPWHAAADFYLEGFPIGSYTALLEVALAGRAFVRKPWLAPPDELPIDRGALAGFEPPSSPADYVAQVLLLCRQPALRARQEASARAATLAVHCNPGWSRQLAALRRDRPRSHSPAATLNVSPMPASLRAYWASYYAVREREDPLQFARRSAQEQGLQPRTDVALLDVLQRARGASGGAADPA